jgi:DNA-binding CsgD family transcriptional regulator
MTLRCMDPAPPCSRMLPGTALPPRPPTGSLCGTPLHMWWSAGKGTGLPVRWGARARGTVPDSAQARGAEAPRAAGRPPRDRVDAAGRDCRVRDPHWQADTTAIRVILANLQNIVLAGLRSPLESDQEVRIVVVAVDARETLTAVAEHEPAVLCVERTFARSDGIDIVRAAALRAGGRGALVSDEVSTRRKRELAILVGASLRDAQIAERLGISEGTVTIHLNRIYLETRDAIARLARPVSPRSRAGSACASAFCNTCGGTRRSYCSANARFRGVSGQPAARSSSFASRSDDAKHGQELARPRIWIAHGTLPPPLGHGPAQH